MGFQLKQTTPMMSFQLVPFLSCTFQNRTFHALTDYVYIVLQVICSQIHVEMFRLELSFALLLSLLVLSHTFFILYGDLDLHDVDDSENGSLMSDWSIHMVRGTWLSKNHEIFHYGLPSLLLDHFRRAQGFTLQPNTIVCFLSHTIPFLPFPNVFYCFIHSPIMQNFIIFCFLLTSISS